MIPKVFKITPLRQLKYIWIFLIPPIFTIYYFVTDFVNGGYGFSLKEVLAFICLTLSFLVVSLAIFTPIYVMHITYYNLDKRKIIEYDQNIMTWTFTENGIINVFSNADIKNVINHWTGKGLRFFNSYEFSVFVLNNNREFTVTCLILDYNTLRKYVPNSKIIEKKHSFPLLSVK